MSSGIKCSVAWGKLTGFSEEYSAYIFVARE
jgi:hypothetical protein